MPINKLSVRQVETAKKPGLYSDGGNLYLQVGPTGTRSWLFRYMIGGRPRKMGMGATHTVSLAEARRRATDLRLKVLDGIDPLDLKHEVRAAEKVAKARVVTFREVAEQFVRDNGPGWKNPVHRAQWTSTLETYVHPIIGDIPVGDVDTHMVLTILRPLWTTKHETGSRVRGRIAAVLDAAKAQGLRKGDNAAAWSGHLKNLLPKRPVASAKKHFKAIPIDDVPSFMVELRERQGLSSQALEFLVLTSSRTNEVVEARWSEIDLEGRLWVVPAGRMKGGREHRVPLSDRALAILEGLPRDDGEFVFPGARRGRPLSNQAMLELMRELRGMGATVHGLRSTFRDWASERTAFPHEVCEMALAHTIANKAEASYRRGDLFEKRRALMEAWSGFCASTPVSGDNVVSLRVSNG